MKKHVLKNEGPEVLSFAARELSQSLGNTFVELVVFEYTEFAVGISILSVTVPEI